MKKKRNTLTRHWPYRFNKCKWPNYCLSDQFDLLRQRPYDCLTDQFIFFSNKFYTLYTNDYITDQSCYKVGL